MNWTMLGAIGEILGAAGVILTLWYLATQVKENTLASRREAMRELLNQNHSFLSQFASDPKTADVFRRGMLDDPNLNPGELAQFRALLLQLTYLWERLFHLDRTASLDPWVVESNTVTRSEMVRAPGYRAFWQERGHWVDAEFRSVIEGEMQGESHYSPLGLRPGEELIPQKME